jgi:hypothetical protein
MSFTPPESSYAKVLLPPADAEALLPLIEEQANEQLGTVAGALWNALETAIKAALNTRSP